MIGRYGGLIGKLKWPNGSFSVFFFYSLGVILLVDLFFSLMVDSTHSFFSEKFHKGLGSMCRRSIARSQCRKCNAKYR